MSFTSNENIKKAYVLITVLKSDYSPIFTQVVEINNICADEPQFKTIFLNTDFLINIHNPCIVFAFLTLPEFFIDIVFNAFTPKKNSI